MTGARLYPMLTFALPQGEDAASHVVTTLTDAVWVLAALVELLNRGPRESSPTRQTTTRLGSSRPLGCSLIKVTLMRSRPACPNSWNTAEELGPTLRSVRSDRH